MHIPTHILSGWCVANVFSLTPRERLFCMVAAVAPDLDGVTRLFGEEAYWDYHHIVCHNLLFCVLTSVVLALFATHRLKVLLICLMLTHLHLVMDYFGSGPGWPIAYGWPFADWTWMNPHAWEFSGWQNRVAALVLLIWTVAIAAILKRTPVELLTPRLDHQFVNWLRRFTPRERK